MSLKLKDIGEFGLIDIIRKSVRPSKGVVVGIGDDAAVLESTGKDLVLLTTDMLESGVHFTKKTRPQEVGHKALGASISDIAAMGGLPTYAVVSLGAPASLPVSYVKNLLKGIDKLAKPFGIVLVGGDMIRSQKIVINVGLLGRVKKKDLIKRDGAKKGDLIFLTGRLGGSYKSGKHLTFVPRVKESQFLVKKFKPTSMIDISDGLVSDLKHICQESRVGAVLYEDRIPRTKGSGINQALYDGEDFELLFTLSKTKARRLRRTRSKFKFYEIGEITSKKRYLQLVGERGRHLDLKEKGFDHYR